MKTLGTAIIAGAALLGAQAFAAETDYVMNCEEVATKLNLEATPEARARYADLEGSCLGVVDRDGELYMHTKVVVRRIRGNTVTVYVPATDRTFEVQAPNNARVTIAGQRVRTRNLSSGQELNIYLAVNELTQPIIQQVHFETETEDFSPAPAVMAAALPTTG